MNQKVKTRTTRYATRLTERRMAELLQTESVVSPEKLVEAMSLKKSEDEMVGEALVNMGVLNEKDLAEIIAAQVSLPYISVAHYSIAKELLEPFDPVYLRKKRVMPLDRIGDVLLVAFAGVMDEKTITTLEEQSGCSLFPCVTTISDIDQAVDTYYGDGNAQEKEDADGSV